jgi:hypothetical protein
MLRNQGNRRPEDRGDHDHGGDVELQCGEERKQPNLNRVKPGIGGDNVNHPGGDNRADYELGSFDKLGHNRASTRRSCLVWAGLSNRTGWGSGHEAENRAGF